MTYSIRALTQIALIAELEANGFSFTDEDGNDFQPVHGAVYSNGSGANVVWLGQIPKPATYDSEGNELTPATVSQHFCANICSPYEMIFSNAVETVNPATPYNVFA